MESIYCRKAKTYYVFSSLSFFLSESSSRPSQLSNTSRQPALQLHNPGPALLMPDVNSDGYEELLFPGRLAQETQPHSEDPSSSETQMLERDPTQLANQLILVCGQSGSILGSPFVLKQCRKFLSLTVKDNSLSYSCLTLKDEGK